MISDLVRESCPVCNTLVDRIVPGYPKDEIDSLTDSLGYQDNLIDSGEPFHLWVIEGPAELADELPFTDIGLDVVWTDNMEPYRTRKVRMLNGPHTMLVAAAYLPASTPCAKRWSTTWSVPTCARPVR